MENLENYDKFGKEFLEIYVQKIGIFLVNNGKFVKVLRNNEKIGKSLKFYEITRKNKFETLLVIRHYTLREIL